MRRFNPGRPCCRACPEDCYVPAYRLPPSIQIYGTTYIERWDRFPVYSGIAPFNSQSYLDYVSNACYSPYSSGEIYFPRWTYERIISDSSITLPDNFTPPPIFSEPIRTYLLRLNNANTLATDQTACRQSRHGGYDYDLCLISETGSDCGQKTIVYTAEKRTHFYNPAECSGVLASLSPYAKLEINIDESVYSNGVIPSGSNHFTYVEGNTFAPPLYSRSGITSNTLNFYNNTVSIPNNPSKLWVTLVASGEPYTAYFECGRDSGSGVVQSHYYKGTLSGSCETWQYYKTHQESACDNSDYTKLRDSSVDTNIQYDRPKGYWRLMDSWKGTIDTVETSGIRTFGRDYLGQTFDWTNVCPILQPYDDVRFAVDRIGGLPAVSPDFCASNYFGGYRPPKDTAVPGLTATVTVEGLTNVASMMNGTYTVPLTSTPSPRQCGRDYTFSATYYSDDIICAHDAFYTTDEYGYSIFNAARELRLRLEITVGVGTNNNYTITCRIGLPPGIVNRVYDYTPITSSGPNCNPFVMTVGDLISIKPCFLDNNWRFFGITLRELIDRGTISTSERFGVEFSYLGGVWGGGGTFVTNSASSQTLRRADGEIINIACPSVTYSYVNSTSYPAFDYDFTSSLVPGYYGVIANYVGCPLSSVIAFIDETPYPKASLVGIG